MRYRRLGAIVSTRTIKAYKASTLKQVAVRDIEMARLTIKSLDRSIAALNVRRDGLLEDIGRYEQQIIAIEENKGITP